MAASVNITFAALSAAETAAAAADKILLGTNAMGGLSSVVPLWVAGVAGKAGDADITDSGAPISRVYDGRTNYQSYGSSQTGHTLFLDFGEPVELDFFAIANHNLYSIGIDTFIVELSDNEDFTTDDQFTVHTSDPSALFSADRRFCDLSLFHTGAVPLRYTNVQYARLTMTGGGAQIPKIGEVVFGRRRMSDYKPNDSWDPRSIESSIERSESLSGVVVDYVRNAGRRFIKASLTATDNAGELVSFFREGNYGTESFVWIEEPASTPNDFLLMKHSDPVFEMPFVGGPTERETTITAIEQGPHFLELEI